MDQTASSEHDIARTYALLGGDDTIGKTVRNNLDVHDLLTSGLPSSALLHFISQLDLLTAETIQNTLGMRARAFHRRKLHDPKSLLSTEQSDRVWKIAAVLGHAIDVLGSKSEAVAWLISPAFGLNQHKPIDLLSTSAGVRSVKGYLTRIEYGVYT